MRRDIFPAQPLRIGKNARQLDMLPKDKELIIYCRVGLRGYVAERLLEQKGYKVRNLAGGWLYYEQMMQDRDRRDV